MDGYRRAPLCWIVGAGDYDAPPALQPAPDDLVIAADRGLESAKRAGLIPTLVVGDFDSLGRVPAGGNVIKLPVEKDVTDTAAAVEEGIKRGCSDFLLLGCTGGRPDHTFAAYQLLADLARRGCFGVMIGDGFSVTALSDGALCFPAGAKGTLSVFAVGGRATGVNLSGVFYPLTDGALDPTFPLGVSNSFTEKPASVSVQRGTLLIFAEGTWFPGTEENGRRTMIPAD